jgi:hypothetical protein
MSDEAEEFRKKLDALKPKKKKLAVPEGFLDEAKSYEGKVMAIRIVAEREKNKVILIFKNMLKPEPLPQKPDFKTEVAPPKKPQPPSLKDKLLGKKRK